MSFRRSLFPILFSMTLTVPFATGTLACGGTPPAKVATVKAGDMPEGGEWTGVYYDQVNGYLHAVKEGDTISAKWRTTAGDAWGELSGKVVGDLLKFEWKEHKIGMVGPMATRTGRGYLKYTAPKAGEAHVVKGEWGLGTDETGMKWEGVKQLNRKPDLDSVMPDEIEGRSTGGGWDSEPAGSGSSGGGEEKKDDMPPAVD
jgi:hypothetical protein